MPAHLRHFDPIDWGCLTSFQPDPEWQQAKAAHRQAQQQWLAEHNVSPLEELRARADARRARHRAAARGLTTPYEGD